MVNRDLRNWTEHETRELPDGIPERERGLHKWVEPPINVRVDDALKGLDQQGQGQSVGFNRHRVPNKI